MPTESVEPIQANAAIVNVAVAVIYYQQQYLLGFRHQEQHQGNRYEFVGGKIDPDETAEVALIREVAEETGIDISDNVNTKMAVKLGRLHHDYGDKQVCLQVYQVELTAPQYEQHQHCEQGLEGQALTWVAKTQLLAGHYPLPAANQTILAWLQLPAQIVITYPLAHFGTQTDATAAWLQYHQQHIAKEAWVYVRLKAENTTEIANQLIHFRPDIYSVLPCDTGSTSSQYNASPLLALASQPKAGHLTHTELMNWFHYSRDARKFKPQEDSQAISLNRPLIISCHDAESINAANAFAAMRLQQKLPPVIGIFISPVLVTETHPEEAALGWEAWSLLAQLADMPVIALGGLSPTMAKQALQYGAFSIAGIRQFLQQ